MAHPRSSALECAPAQNISQISKDVR